MTTILMGNFLTSSSTLSIFHTSSQLFSPDVETEVQTG